MKIFVEQSLAKTRYNICKECEYLMNDKPKCTQCNCNMKDQVKVTNFACPVGKWEKVNGYA